MQLSPSLVDDEAYDGPEWQKQTRTTARERRIRDSAHQRAAKALLRTPLAASSAPTRLRQADSSAATARSHRRADITKQALASVSIQHDEGHARHATPARASPASSAGQSPTQADSTSTVLATAGVSLTSPSSVHRTSSLPRLSVSTPHVVTSADQLLGHRSDDSMDDEEAQWGWEAEEERRIHEIGKAEERKETDNTDSYPTQQPLLLSTQSDPTRAIPTNERQPALPLDSQQLERHYSPMPISDEQAHTRPPPTATELTLFDPATIPTTVPTPSPTAQTGVAAAPLHVTSYDSPLLDEDFPVRSSPLSRHSSLASDVTASTNDSSRHQNSASSLSSLGTEKLRQLLTSRLTSLDNTQLRRVIAAVEQMDNNDTGTDTETEGDNTGADTDREGDEPQAGGERTAQYYDDEREQLGGKGEGKDGRRRKKKHHRGGRRKRRDDLDSAHTPPTASPSSSRHPQSSSAMSASQQPTATAAPTIPPSFMVHRDWNEEFQSLLSTVSDDETVLDNQHSFEQLSELAADFAFTARAIGRIIISEKYLSKDEKTIPLAQIGGIAGGEKYMSHNILFKFQNDYMNLYGGDEHAAAAGNHELVGLSAYYRVISTLRGVGIHVPLACLIDYRGFRLWAVSRLPISSHTLILGSNDGGSHIVNLDPNVSRSMGLIAQHLNLKPHYVQDKSGKHTLLYGPFDIEGHRGTDGRVYLIDFHRVFPPEPTQASAHLQLRNAHLHRLLRPELVRSNEKALSSDAYVKSSEVRSDGKREAEEEVKEAYERLVAKVIPRFAEQLDKLGSLEHIDRVRSVHQRSTERWIMESALQEPSRPNSSAVEEPAVGSQVAVNGEVTAEDVAAVALYRTRLPASPSVSRAPSPAPSPPPSPSVRMSSDVQSVDPIAYSPRFISYLHQAGINIRLLGVLRSHVTTPALRDVLLVEMLARVLKSDMRQRWRDKMATYKYISDGVYRRCSIDFVNLIFCRSEHSTRYWQTNIKRQLSEKFNHSLTPEESQPHFNLKASLLPMLDERLSGAAPAVPSANAGNGSDIEAAANSSTLPVIAHPIYHLSSSQERRLTALLHSDSTNDSQHTSSHATPGTSAPSSPRVSVPPLSSATASTSVRRDLLRLVFLRFIHLTGLVLQEGVIPAHQHVYNQPSVPMPAYGGSSSRWEGRRNSGNWDTPSSFAAPSLPPHSNSLPPRLNGNSSGGHGRHTSSQGLSITSNSRSQTSQQLPSIHRSTSSNNLPSVHPIRPTSQFSFANSLSTPASSSSISSALPSTVLALHPSVSSGSSASTLTSSFFLFYERPMEDIHLTSIEEQVKTLNIVSYAEGTALMCKCVSKSRHEDGSAADDEHTALTQYLADLAEAKFKESLRRNVDDCLALCNYSMLVSLVHKDNEQAKALLLSAIYANSSHHRSYYYLAQLYFYTYRQHRVAEFLYRSALRLNPRHVNSHKDFANLLYYGNRDTVRAEQHFRTAVTLQPDHIKAQLGLGMCLAHKAREWSDWEAVMDCYRKAGSSNYGEEATRLKSQHHYLLLLVVKAQLHADRREVEPAVQCFEESLAFRPAALLPHQLAAQRQRDAEAGHSTATVFPPAAALVNYALFESLRKRWRHAQTLFLQAIQQKTGLMVNFQQNTLLLPATVAGLPLDPQHVLPVSVTALPSAFSFSPRSSLTSVLMSPSSRPMSSTPTTAVASSAVVLGTTSPGASCLPATSVWAVSAASALASPLATAISTTAAVPSALTTALRVRMDSNHAEPSAAPAIPPQHAVTTQKTAASPRSTASVSDVRPAPASSSSSTASSSSTSYALTSSPATAVPWSLALSSSPPTAPSNVWQQRRKWLPDTNNAPNTQKTGAAKAVAPGPPRAGPLALTPPLAAYSSRPSSPQSASPSESSVSSQSSDKSAASVGPPSVAVETMEANTAGTTMNGLDAHIAAARVEEAEAAVVVDEVDSDTDTTDGEVAALARAFSSTSQQLQEEAMLEAAPDTSLTPSASSKALPPTSTATLTRRQRYHSTLSQSELAERADEENLESSCVDTAIIRLYVEALLFHQPDDLDAIERWLRYACLLSPYGRSGSLNFAAYADFLYRYRRLQFDAQQCFYRAIASSTPAPEALYKYAAYLMDVVQDKKRSRQMRDRADEVKLVASNSHLCHRIKAGWYCEGRCELSALKLLISSARVRNNYVEKQWGRPAAKSAGQFRRANGTLQTHSSTPQSRTQPTSGPIVTHAATKSVARQSLPPTSAFVSGARPVAVRASAATNARSSTPSAPRPPATVTALSSNASPFSSMYSSLPAEPSPSVTSASTSSASVTPPYTPALSASTNAAAPIARTTWCDVAKSCAPPPSNTAPTTLPPFGFPTAPSPSGSSNKAVALPAFRPPPRNATSPPSAVLPVPAFASLSLQSSPTRPMAHSGGVAAAGAARAVLPQPFPAPVRR